MELTPPVRDLITATADSFVGAARRRYIAQTVTRLDLSQRRAQRLFGWGRDTIRKALHEHRSGFTCTATAGRGRKPAEHHLPRLLDDIRAVVADHVQADPTLQTTRVYCRLTAAEVHRQLIDRYGYTADQLPCAKTIGVKLNALGFRLRKVAKCRPQKKYRRPTPSSPA
jgi:transposase